MGQRHQFFAIARINNRYRPLAVVHNQWFYGHGAVRQCLNTMRILSATGNLQNIRRDLKLAESRPESFWEAKPRARGDDQDRGVDFPFVTMCLTLGCCIKPDRQDDYIPSRVTDISIDAKYDGVDNNDGISVFDVTIPSKPKYAMIQLSKYEDFGDEWDEDGEIITELDTTSDAFEPNTVLNASDYLLRYWRESSNDSDKTRARMLDNLPQIDVAALNSAWPHGDFRARKHSNDTADAEKEDSPANAVQSLTTASMRTVVGRIVQGDPSSIKLLAEAEQVPGFTESLRAHLIAHPDIVQGRPLSILLGHVHRKCASVDLSSFGHLSFDDILSVVEIVASSGDAFSLTLPDLEDLTASGLRKLLSNGLIHGLRLGKHQIGELEKCLEAIDGTSVTSFNSPELYPRSFAPVDFSHARTREELERFGLCRPWKSPVSSLPRPKQFPVTQLVFVEWPATETPPAQLRKDWVLPWSELLDSEAQKRDDIDAMLLSLPMSDYFISAGRWIKTLPRFLAHLARPNSHGGDLLVGSAVLGILRRVALKDDLTVESTPGELTAFAKRMAGMSPSPFAPTLPLKQGQYTIVIFYEHNWDVDREHPLRLRYGFATLDLKGKIQVLSAPEFAQVHEPAAQATELAREWEQEDLGLSRELERGHRRAMRGPVEVEGRGYRLLTDEEVGRIIADDDAPSLRLEESSPAEVDELFGALSRNGRLVFRDRSG